MKRLTAMLGAGALLVALIGLGAPVAQAKCGDSPKPKVDWSKCDKERLNLREQDLSGAIFLRTGDCLRVGAGGEVRDGGSE